MISTSGVVKPCVSYNDDTLIYVPQKTLQDYFHGAHFEKIRKGHLSGEIPQGCKTCVSRRNRGLPTKWERAESRRRFSSFPVPYDNPHLQFVEVAMTNHCNMNCAMCSMEYSSKWIRPELEFRKQNSFRPYDPRWEKSFSVSKSFVNQVEPIVEDLVYGIELIGGEPLMVPETQFLLEMVAEKKPDLPIYLITNFSILNDSLIEVLGKLKNLNLHLSIDGVGEIYEYIRGFPYREIKNNLQKISLIEPKYATIVPVLSMYNIFQLKELLAELVSFAPVRLSHFVHFPEYLAICLLPKDLKEKAVANLRSLKGKNFGGPFWEQDLERLIQFVGREPGENYSFLIEKARTWTRQMNRLRKKAIWEIEPEMNFLNFSPRRLINER